MNKYEYFYPLWLRIWHWSNALLFFFLIISGISMQYSGMEFIVINFDIAIKMHNICGVLLTINYLVFFILNIISGNLRQYIPSRKDFFRKNIIQAKYYLSGIFKNEPHPYDTTRENKFNPLQQVTYLKIMYVLMPVIIITGLGLLFPETLLDNFFGESGLFYTSILHIITGFILSLFMIGHIYLATTGNTITENFRSMITGWHKPHKEN